MAGQKRAGQGRQGTQGLHKINPTHTGRQTGIQAYSTPYKHAYVQAYIHMGSYTERYTHQYTQSGRHSTITYMHLKTTHTNNHTRTHIHAYTDIRTH